MTSIYLWKLTKSTLPLHRSGAKEGGDWITADTSCYAFPSVWEYNHPSIWVEDDMFILSSLYSWAGSYASLFTWAWKSQLETAT